MEATRDVEAALPFAILGFDCDNGSEFLNWHLVGYFAERGKTKSASPDHVRITKTTMVMWSRRTGRTSGRLLGYDRLEDPALRAAINALYRDISDWKTPRCAQRSTRSTGDIWEPFHNYFCPSAKLLSKDRPGAKIKRRHDRPMTPCDRLLASPDVAEATKKKLRQTRAALNPFDLQRRLDTALRPILQRALRSSRPTGSLHSKPVAATPPLNLKAAVGRGFWQ